MIWLETERVTLRDPCRVIQTIFASHPAENPDSTSREIVHTLLVLTSGSPPVENRVLSTYLSLRRELALSRSLGFRCATFVAGRRGFISVLVVTKHHYAMDLPARTVPHRYDIGFPVVTLERVCRGDGGTPRLIVHRRNAAFVVYRGGWYEGQGNKKQGKGKR